MKRNILTVLLVSIFALTFSFGFVGCKKNQPADEQKVEENTDKAAPSADETKDVKKEETKKEAAK